MRRFITPLLIFLFCLLIPFLLNWFLQIPSFCSIVGSDTDWLQFWGAYIPGIASFVMIYYTWKTIDTSHNDSERNIQFQREMKQKEDDNNALQLFLSWESNVIEVMSPLSDLKLRDLISTDKLLEAKYYGKGLLTSALTAKTRLSYLVSVVPFEESYTKKLINDYEILWEKFQQNISEYMQLSVFLNNLKVPSDKSGVYNSFISSLKADDIGKDLTKILSNYSATDIENKRNEIIDKLVTTKQDYVDLYFSFVSSCNKAVDKTSIVKLFSKRENAPANN